MTKRSYISGFSLVEILVALALGGVVFAAGYQVFAKYMKTSGEVIRDTKVEVEAKKALDRLFTEFMNVVSIYGSKATILGGMPPTTTSCSVGALSYTGSIAIYLAGSSTPMISSTSYTLFGSGIVPLPGLKWTNIDPAGTYTVVRPSDAASYYFEPVTGYTPFTISTSWSDGIRILHQPKEAVPTRLASSGGKTYTQITLTDIGDLKVGDYAVISDSGSRELFRITGVSGNVIQHTTTSFWNRSFPRDYTSSATVMKVGLVTYAHDLTNSKLMRDDHVKDDGFNTLTGTFTAGTTRSANWQTAATGVKKFTIKYKVYNTSTDKTNGVSQTTRTPRTGQTAPEPRTETCKSQIGFPLFKQVTFEMEIDPSTTGESRTKILTRTASPDGLEQSGVQENNYDAEAKVYGATTPTPCGGACPTATPGSGDVSGAGGGAF